MRPPVLRVIGWGVSQTGLTLLCEGEDGARYECRWTLPQGVARVIEAAVKG